jgi:hypothetical protein
MDTDIKPIAALRQLQQTITEHGKIAGPSISLYPYRIAKAAKLSKFIG